MQGKVLGNRYEIIEKIGGGGMALVYKAKCRLLNRYVAIKVLREEFTNDEEFIIKFSRESQAAASLSHQNIVNIYDVGHEENEHYIVMEYIDGITLKDYIAKKKCLTSEETIQIAIQIGDALNHAHKNQIIHRDIKPHNIMINHDRAIKVMDFGIARATTSTTLVDGGDVIGSVHYFSPEQARGGYTDAKSDIYSLGIVMYEMLTGRVPFEGESPINVALKHIQEQIEFENTDIEKIPENLRNIVLKCVQKEQSLRYKNAIELLDDLRKVKYNKEECIDLDDCLKFEDSPTMVMQAVKEPKKHDEKEIKKRSNKNDLKSEKTKKEVEKVQLTSRATMLIAVFSALVVAFALFFGYVKAKEFFSGPIEVEMPLLVGFNEKIAQTKAEEMGLKLNIREHKFNDKYTEGTVIWQSVNRGNKLKEGYVVDIDISKGYNLVEVPDLMGKMSNQVKQLLEETELKVGESTLENSELPEEIVIRQEPEAFEKVPEGTKVNYVISKGPVVKTLMMPKMVGNTLNGAKKEIEALGLKVGKVSYEDNAMYAKGIISNQTPDPSSEVKEGDSINFVVSNGAKIIEKPEEKETIVSEPEKETTEPAKPEDSKDESSTISKKGKGVLKLILPQDKEKTNIKIYQINDGQEKLIYNQDHIYNKSGVEITLLGYGQLRVRVYYDDVLKGEKDIVFKED